MKTPVDLLNFKRKQKLPLILQTELAECGLACLAMVASYHGYKCDLVTLRTKHSIPLTGASLKSVMAIAEHIELSPRPIKVDLNQLAGLRTPAILHWDLSHFVVLESVKSDRIVIYDPAKGIRELDAETASKHYTGVALELMPTKSFEQRDERSSVRLSDFWGRISGLGGSLAQILALSIVLQLFALVSPLYMQTVVDEAVLSRDQNLLVVLSFGFLMLAIIEIITRMFRSYVVLVISSALSIQMASNLFHHLIRLPLKYFENRHMGDTISRFGSLKSIRDILTTGFVEAIVDGLMSIVMIVVLFLYSPSLAFIIIGAVCIYLVIRLIFFQRFKDLNEEAISTGASEQTNFMETVRGIQAIKMFCNETERMVLWQNRYADSTNASIRLGRYTIGFEFANGLLFAVENILVVYLGAMLILENQFTIGMLYAFVSYKSSFSQNAQRLIEKIIGFKMVKLHLERIADIIKTEQEQTAKEHNSIKTRIVGQLEFRNLSYRYSENESFIFDSVSFCVEAGEVVALVGASGCGKTTLMKVMLGLFPPTKGQILVDGCKLEEFGLKNYREQICAVMQNDKLFSGSISDNISFFDAQPDMDLVMKCAKSACLHDEIMRMPMKYNSLVGDMGTTLSGGQMQRVLLARALYKKPRILFLDEASSHLDSNNEQKVNEHLREMKITRIIIAHRESTIELADRVFTLFDGQLVEIDQEEFSESLL